MSARDAIGSSTVCSVLAPSFAKVLARAIASPVAPVCHRTAAAAALSALATEE